MNGILGMLGMLHQVVRICSCLLNKLLNMSSVYFIYFYILTLYTVVYYSQVTCFRHYVEIFDEAMAGAATCLETPCRPSVGVANVVLFLRSEALGRDLVSQSALQYQFVGNST